MSNELIIVIIIGVVALTTTIITNSYLTIPDFLEKPVDYFYTYVTSIFFIPYVLLHELSHLLTALFTGIKYSYVHISATNGNYLYTNYTDKKTIHTRLEIIKHISMISSGYVYPNILYPSIMLFLMLGNGWILFYITCFIITYLITIRSYHEIFTELKYIVVYRIIGAILFIATLSHGRYLIIIDFLEKYYVFPIILVILLVHVLYKKYDYFTYLVVLLGIFYITLKLEISHIYYIYFTAISWALSIWLMIGHLLNLRYNDENDSSDDTDSEIIGNYLGIRPLKIGILIVSYGILTSFFGLILIYMQYKTGGILK